MAHNESIYRIVREALEDDTTISELLNDVGAALESYLQQADEESRAGVWGDATMELPRGVRSAERLLADLRVWEDI